MEIANTSVHPLENQTKTSHRNPASQPIVLTTDFGLADPFVGVMKGVVLGINPTATIIDLTHQIRPQNVQQAAFVLGTSYRFFSAGSIHVVVVDPGVGTSRQALLLVTPLGRFLAPDNGVLSYILGDHLEDPPAQAGKIEVPPDLTAYTLTNSRYWLHPVSHTFHGRDIFGPVAAHLSLGVPPEEMGARARQLVWLPAPRPEVKGASIRGEVINVDRFGNLVTNIPENALSNSGKMEIGIKGRLIKELSRTYNEGGPSTPRGLIALVGSNGYLEIALPSGSAALTLEADVGEPVHVTAKQQP